MRGVTEAVGPSTVRSDSIAAKDLIASVYETTDLGNILLASDYSLGSADPDDKLHISPHSLALCHLQETRDWEAKQLREADANVLPQDITSLVLYAPTYGVASSDDAHMAEKAELQEAQLQEHTNTFLRALIHEADSHLSGDSSGDGQLTLPSLTEIIYKPNQRRDVSGRTAAWLSDQRAVPLHGVWAKQCSNRHTAQLLLELCTRRGIPLTIDTSADDTHRKRFEYYSDPCCHQEFAGSLTLIGPPAFVDDFLPDRPWGKDSTVILPSLSGSPLTADLVKPSLLIICQDDKPGDPSWLHNPHYRGHKEQDPSYAQGELRTPEYRDLRSKVKNLWEYIVRVDACQSGGPGEGKEAEP